MSSVVYRLSAALFASAMLCTTAAQSGTEKILYCFDAGANPMAGMNRVNGVFYGTTEYGGSGSCSSDFGSGCGAVFSFDPATQQEKVVYSFAGGRADGELPYGHLRYTNGALYGTTYMGGGSKQCKNSYGSGCGTVFSIDLSTGKETVLRKFQGGSTDGAFPFATPYLADAGSMELIGTTEEGGNTGCGNVGCGTIFKIDLSSGKETVVYAFQDNGADAVNPVHDWTRLNGKLYSTTEEGGTYGLGTVFSIDLETGAEHVVHSFGKGSDGQTPYAGMTELNGILYGTTINGGSAASGTLFSLDPATGKEKVLHSFRGIGGVNPVSDLIRWKGLLYGTTAGGHYGAVVFAFNPGTNAETVVADDIDLGRDPFENMRLRHMDGALYDTTPQAEACNFNGSIYTVTH
jgi:uncharacterized repeat protein (TIGR03803 family)